MKRKNILFHAHLAAVLFLLLMSPVLAQNSCFITLDGGQSFGINSGGNVLNVSTEWTFEAWINVHNYVPANEECIMDRRTVFSFYLIDANPNSESDYAIRFVAKGSGDTTDIAILRSDGLGDGDTETPMFFNTWYHVAATYNDATDATARLYINSDTTDTDTDAESDWNFPSTLSMAMSIGHKTVGSVPTRYLTNTDIDEIRISNVARAIGDMQTTTTSNPYSVDANTYMLMHLDDWAVPVTYISDLPPSQQPTTFYYNIGPGDYEPATGLPLPVELTSFSAQVNEGEVTLNWETETEVDNYGFDIERKTKDEGRETWEVIGFVEGNGNSNSPKQYSFTDKNPVGGSNFSYRLKQIDTDGKFEYSDFVKVLLVPDEFFLSQNFPNPFNPSTTIEFSLTQTSHIALEIFNTLGERVGVLASEELSAGTYNYKWDASNLTSGIYFYILQAGNFIQTRKMILLK